MDIFTIPGRDYDSNVYMIMGQTPTIIDTGTGFYSQRIIETIKKITMIHNIRQILLTHDHFDHVGGVNDILQAVGGSARVFAHSEVVSKLKEGKSTFAEMLGGVMPKIEVDVPLTDNTQIIIGDESYQVLVTPGHSIGSLCFYCQKSEVLFSGDTIFAHGGFGRYDFPGGDFRLLLHSIERLSRLHIKNLYPGHGPIVETCGKDHVVAALSNIRSLI
jgi:glyoxylase-like metal-dependent hydrolase (beta-lactamase superfamily II)